MEEKNTQNYVNLKKVYTRAEDKRFKAEDVIFFFDDYQVPGVSEKNIPRWTGHRVLAVINPQQYQL